MNDILGRPIHSGDLVCYFTARTSLLQIGIVEDDGVVTVVLPSPRYGHLIKVQPIAVPEEGIPDILTRSSATLQRAGLIPSYIRQGRRVCVIKSLTKEAYEAQ